MNTDIDHVVTISPAARAAYRAYQDARLDMNRPNAEVAERMAELKRELASGRTTYSRFEAPHEDVILDRVTDDAKLLSRLKAMIRECGVDPRISTFDDAKFGAYFHLLIDDAIEAIAREDVEGLIEATREENARLDCEHGYV